MPHAIIEINTASRTQLKDITRDVQHAVTESGCAQGICVVFIPHTTAAVTINENADPDVSRDITKELDKLVPWNGDFAHSEGNSAAHIKASLFGFSETIIIENNVLQLGTWQGIYFAEFDGPRRRKVWVTVIKSQ